MTSTSELEKELPQAFLDTNLNSQGKISEAQDNLAIFINNILLFCKLLKTEKLDS